ncbi:cupin domain-containing protein [Mycobacterium riyadhense]|nr:cupin domain-containing protein [Mycobacterium riyadhense]MCV7144979.1 cupin domain-containing protein [Mycobacterium riyadhense]ORW72084.1 cupin [Mycobacterium riyadhense]
MTESTDWAHQLDLSPHPEGGWFRETWRSELTISQSTLPSHYDGPRCAGTATLFLLTPGQQSAWHTVRSAELWLFHRGGPLLLEIGRDQSSAKTYVLGPDFECSHQLQVLVPAGYWQRARPLNGKPSLVSCVVVPGFDFSDFALSGAS